MISPYCDSGYYWKIKENSKIHLYIISSGNISTFPVLIPPFFSTLSTLFIFSFAFLHFCIYFLFLLQSFLFSYCHSTTKFIPVLYSISCFIRLNFFCCILPLCYFLMQFFITISWFLYTTFLYQLFFILWAHFFLYFHAALCKSLNLMKSK